MRGETNITNVLMGGVQSDIKNLVEKQTISTSGFDGTQKETQLTIPTMKSGYTPYIIGLTPQATDATHYISGNSQPNATTGKFYIYHNLKATVTYVTAFIMWIPS